MDFERRFRHRISRPTLQVLIAISLADGLVLPVLVWAALTQRLETVITLGPTHATLFLLLVGTLAVLAQHGHVGWRFVGAVTILGPLASIPGLELYRRTERH